MPVQRWRSAVHRPSGAELAESGFARTSAGDRRSDRREVFYTEAEFLDHYGVLEHFVQALAFGQDAIGGLGELQKNFDRHFMAP
jgi:hypothetical protein